MAPVPGKTGETSEVIERIIALRQGIYVALRSSLAEHWMHVDYTMPQLKVLLYLYTDGPSRMRDLASALRVSMPSATGIVDRLVQRGLIDRHHDPEDRRVVFCHLSPEGEKQVSALWSASIDLLRDVLRNLSPEELATVATANELVLRAAEQARVKLAPQETDGEVS